MKTYLWKIGGEAGFGIMTSGLAFAKVMTRSGYEIFDYNEYPSLIRGGHNTFEVAISDRSIGASKHEIDLLVCLNKDTYTLHKHRLTSSSLVVYDPEDITPEVGIGVAVPFKSIKKENNVMQVMLNTVAIGVSLALVGGSLEIFKNILEEEFSRKGQEVVDFNLKFAKIGFDYVTANHSANVKQLFPKKDTDAKVVATGNDMFSLGAVAADCRLYAAYPMTPSSTVLSSLAAWQDKTGMVVRHAEDEISVVNTALGAAYTGVRAAVGTSGGGYALMTESVSYAGLAEIPLVLFMSMRPGPATGMPTWTDQGDLLFVLHGGHGEFPKIVLAPGDIHEMFELTLKAFDLADIYQVPVLLASDKFLSESYQSFPVKVFEDIIAGYKPNYGKTISEVPEGQKYLRYADTEDGISPRLIPGTPGHFYQANSYEHVEDGHTTEDSEPRIQQVHKRAKKTQTYLKNHFVAPKQYGNQNAEICFVSWGSTKGIILEAQHMLKERGVETNFIHFTHLFPLDPHAVGAMIPTNRRCIMVETNSHAQFRSHLRAETGVFISETLLKYDGRPFYPEEIVEYVTSKK